MGTRGFEHRDLAVFCQEMALMLHAGIGVAEGLELLAEEEKDPRWHAVLSDMARRAGEGMPFADVVRETGGFPAYMTGLIATGEHTGNLEEALSSLKTYYEERERLDQRLRSALLYPSILFLLILVVIVVLLARVLPMFRSVYASLGGEMAGVAGALLQVGLWLNRIMPVLCVLFGLVLVFLLAFSIFGAFRERVLGFWRKRTRDRGAARAMHDACLAQAVSIGLSSGLSAEDSMELAAQVLSDVPSAQARCAQCKQALDEGDSLAEALGKAGIFPPSARRLLSLGMQSGSGDVTMRELADRLSEDADLAMSKKIARIEPALVLTGSVLVGAVLLSVMLPLIDIMEMIG